LMILRKKIQSIKAEASQSEMDKSSNGYYRTVFHRTVLPPAAKRVLSGGEGPATGVVRQAGRAPDGGALHPGAVMVPPLT